MVNWNEIDELAGRAKADDGAAELLIRSLAPWLRGFFRSEGANDDDAEDLAQDVAVKMYRHRRSFDSKKARYSTWLRQIARRLWIDFYRRKILEQIIVPLPENVSVETMVQAQEQVEQQEQMLALEECVDNLQDPLRMVVVLRTYEDMQLKEIAQKIRRKEATVRDWYRRGKSALGTCMDEKGFKKSG